jgi:hypothetical protein
MAGELCNSIMANAILNINQAIPMILPKKKANRGQTLFSLLTALTLFGILGHAIYTLTTSSFEMISFTRARIAARHLGQEKMEVIRNLPYDDVGTVGGIPSGTLLQSENTVRNGLNYEVKTSIIYVDDPFDGTAPDDLLPTDYKRVRVDVSWEGIAASRRNPVVLVSDIAPRGVETTAGGGTLSILVFDANAQPVAQADVSIVAETVDPPVDLELKTNDNGRIVLPGTPVCTDCYQITATKEGYSLDRTYSTTEIANPNKPHLSIIEGELTEVSFAIDKTSTLHLASVSDRDNNFETLTNVEFRFRGEKILGTDVNDEPVYKFDKLFNTGDSGELTITDVEWDNYEIILSDTSGLDIAGTNPLIPLPVLPDTEVDLTFALTSGSGHRLLAIFTDPSLAPIASVSAVLSDELGFEEAILSGAEDNPDFGQAFFANLSEQTYTLEATASGFLDFSGELEVSEYTKEGIILTPE